MVLRCQPLEFHALVVDDDAIVRRMVSFALTQEGFACDTAVDGADAITRMSKSRYDLVVTDLHMPNKNGHALSVNVLTDESRPVIIVHTSVDEPRLTRDLILRGVDDVIHKPTNYETFAIKARCLAKRRHARHEEAGSHTAAISSDTTSKSESDGVQRSRIPISEVEKRERPVNRMVQFTVVFAC